MDERSRQYRRKWNNNNRQYFLDYNRRNREKLRVQKHNAYVKRKTRFEQTHEFDLIKGERERNKVSRHQESLARRRLYKHEWYVQNRPRIAAQKKQKHKRDPLPGRLRAAKWRLDNPERFKQALRGWAAKNPEKKLRAEKEYHHKVRLDLLRVLGEICVRCNEKRDRYLEIDHIHNDGKQERKNIGESYSLYRFYVKRPTLAVQRLQILCKRHHEEKHHGAALYVGDGPGISLTLENFV